MSLCPIATSTPDIEEFHALARAILLRSHVATEEEINAMSHEELRSHIVKLMAIS